MPEPRDSTPNDEDDLHADPEILFEPYSAFPESVALVRALDPKDASLDGPGNLKSILRNTNVLLMDDQEMIAHILIAHVDLFADVVGGRELREVDTGADPERIAQHSALHQQVPGHESWNDDDLL